MMDTARTAILFGVNVVNGIIGSAVWKNIYFFPPTTQYDINKGYEDFEVR
jgi:hypothetical protein